MSRIVETFGLFGLILACGGLMAGQDPVMKAMQDELARSMESLRMEELDKPYFVSYRVDQVETMRAAAEFGSLLSRDEDRRRTLDVQVRVGDHALDNTNFMSFSTGGSGVLRGGLGGVSLPLGDDYREVRRQIWLATDAAYKQALEDFSKKKAVLQNKTRTDEVPDFSKEEPVQIPSAPPAELPDLDKAAALVRELSGLFRKMPAISVSRVTLTARVVHSRYVNSEGTSYLRSIPEVQFTATAVAQAADGMLLHDFVDAYGRTLADLPDKDSLVKRIGAMGDRLSGAREAPLIETYNGPVLFEQRAAAELLAQVLAPKLAATPKSISDNPMFESFMAQDENPFLDKLGARVLPRFMAVVDDPTLAEFAGQPLLGGYTVDDEGVPGRKTSLIERGMLKSFLTGRSPVPGGLNSTGNRRGAGVAPSNLVISASQGLPADELKEELLALVQDRELEYGVIVRSMINPLLIEKDAVSPMMILIGGPQGRKPSARPLIAAYRVNPDGSEQLLRNVELGETGVGALKEIVAVSEQQTVHTLPVEVKGGSPFSMFAMIGGGGSKGTLVSVVTPALLFEDLTLKKPTGEIPNPPVANHPFFEK